MKAKYIKLLHYLNEQDNWVSSTQLAEKFGLSKRTIKSYIADIQDNESDLILSSNKGYRVIASNLVTFSITQKQVSLKHLLNELLISFCD